MWLVVVWVLARALSKKVSARILVLGFYVGIKFGGGDEIFWSVLGPWTPDTCCRYVYSRCVIFLVSHTYIVKITL